MTVGIYAVVLMLVPSRYTVGSFAVTASMLVALLATVQLLFAKTTTRPIEGAVRTPRRSPPVVTALLAFGAAMLASYVVSHLSFLPGPEAASADRNLARLVVALALAIACAAGVRSRRQVEAIVWALVIAAAVVAVVGILQFQFGVAIENAFRPPGFAAEPGATFIASRAGFHRVAGTARHPIEMGIVWAAILPLALYLSMQATRSRARHVATICTILIVAALPLTLSRSALLAAAAAVAVSALGWSWSRRLEMAWLAAAALVVLPSLVPGLLDALQGLFNGDVGSASLASRAAANQQLLELASKSMWIGHGFGTFISFDVGNTYVELLYDVGIVGVSAFVLLIAACLIRAAAVRQQAADPATRDLALALIASVLAICVGGWGLNVFRYPMMQGVLFLAFGLIGALAYTIAPATSRAP